MIGTERRTLDTGLAVMGLAAIVALGFGAGGYFSSTLHPEIIVAMAIGTLGLIDHLMRPRATAPAASRKR